jgi:hypothetical protein
MAFPYPWKSRPPHHKDIGRDLRPNIAKRKTCSTTKDHDTGQLPCLEVNAIFRLTETRLRRRCGIRPPRTESGEMNFIRAIIKFSVVCAMLLLSSAGSAQTVRLGKYRHPANEKMRLLNKVYLAGVIGGLVGYAVVAKREKLFCLPPSLALTAEQAEDVMLRWAKKFPDAKTDEMPISLPLLWGLRETFPCNQ